MIAERTLLIGLYSPRQQSGKTTTALLMKDRIAGSSIMSFALPLKLATAAFLEAMGLSDAEATRYVFDAKDTPILQLGGKTGRDFLVKLGTDAGREFVYPTVWVDALFRKAEPFLAQGRSIIVDDVRNADEADAIEAHGGKLVRVERSAEPVKANPERIEGMLEGRTFADTITNYTTLTNLQQQVRLTVGKLRRAA